MSTPLSCRCSRSGAGTMSTPTVAIACGALLLSIIGCNIYNIDGVDAFSPSYRTATSRSVINANIKIRVDYGCATANRKTHLAYKHLDDANDPLNANRNATAASASGPPSSRWNPVANRHWNETSAPNSPADAGKSEFGDSEIIFYDDIEDDDAIDVANEVFASDLESAIQEMNSIGGGGKDNVHQLIQEQEQPMNPVSNADAGSSSKPVKAVQPSKVKPSKGFVSPIRMIEKVPKVTPIHMSTVFFLQLTGDPAWPKTHREGGESQKSDDLRKGDGTEVTEVADSFAKDTKEEIGGVTTDFTKSANKVDNTVGPKVENWKTTMEKNRKPKAFRAANYLESLSGANPEAKDGDSTDGTEENDLMKSVRNQQGELRRKQLEAQQRAIQEATRRTNPKEAYEKRMNEEQAKRKRDEREKLERLYVERKERLDAKKRNEQRYLEERKRQKEILEAKATQRAGKAATAAAADSNGVGEAIGAEENEELELPDRDCKRGVPILARPFVKAPPLLVGSTVVMDYSTLTPFQRRSLDVAIENHQEHIERMRAEEEDMELLGDTLTKAGDEGGIQAAPIIAVIDDYTADATAKHLASMSSRKLPDSNKRYATLASVEVVEGKAGGPGKVKLMGVGRILLSDYFLSRDVGVSSEEQELSKLLARISHLASEEIDHEDEASYGVEDDDNDDEQRPLPVVMAEFQVLLDDSSFLSEQSTKYGEDVTKNRASELYRTANKVYRLHEERKQLVAGLKAGVSRLRLGKTNAISAAVNDYCDAEFEDCDGIGRIGVMLADGPPDHLQEESSQPVSWTSEEPRSHLEALENYGLGSSGVVSTIPDLTKEVMSLLEPYYSPAYRDREEYEAEIASFVVFKSLENIVTPQEVAEALVMPSSATRRLEMGYDIMMRHRNELAEFVRRISKELMDCGEECSDMW